MKTTLIVTSILTGLSGLAHSAQVVDVLEIAGKSREEVATYLGAEKSCEETKYGPKCYYSKGEVEVLFIDGSADWITVEAMETEPFSKAALKAIGLNEVPPSFSSSFTMRWESIQGFQSVSFFKGASNTDYAYIKVSTK